MRALPNMAVIEPCGEQIAAAVRASLDYDGPVYLRLQVTRGCADPEVPLASMQSGRGIILREGTDGAIVACGIMVKEALTAADSLATKGVSITVVNMPSLKPLDSALVRDLARHHPLIVSAENHSVIGGLGAAGSGDACARRLPMPLRYYRRAGHVRRGRIEGLPDAAL